MKEFHSWVSDQAGKYIDGSEIKRSDRKELLKKPTNLQVRAALSDVLVPFPTTPDQIEDWISAFCVCLTDADEGKRSVRNGWLPDLVSQDVSDAYVRLETPFDYAKWYSLLRLSIATTVK
jgi:hypothetical protein